MQGSNDCKTASKKRRRSLKFSENINVISTLKNAKMSNLTWIKVSRLTYSTPQKMSRPTVGAACVMPPPQESKRSSSGAAAGPLSPLSGYWKLRQQMSKKEKPLSKWEESFHHRLLNRGAAPKSQFTITRACYETSACQLMYVPRYDRSTVWKLHFSPHSFGLVI